jgi:hypothetical protein
MIDIEQSELGPTIMRELQERMEYIRQQEVFGPMLLHRINDLLTQTRLRCRHQNIDFPVMAAIIIPSSRDVFLLRADMERKGIEQFIVNTMTQYPELNMRELAEGIHRAFPSFKPN